MVKGQQPALARIGLDSTDSLRERVLRRLVQAALRRQAREDQEDPSA